MERSRKYIYFLLSARGPACPSGARVVCRLEVVAQAELHAARSREQVARDTQRSGVGKSPVDRGWIEAHRVGGVVGLPRKLQRAELSELPRLAEACIHIEIAVPAEEIALADLSRIGNTNRGARRDAASDGVRIGKKLWVSV